MAGVGVGLLAMAAFLVIAATGAIPPSPCSAAACRTAADPFRGPAHHHAHHRRRLRPPLIPAPRHPGPHRRRPRRDASVWAQGVAEPKGLKIAKARCCSPASAATGRGCSAASRPPTAWSAGAKAPTSPAQPIAAAIRNPEHDRRRRERLEHRAAVAPDTGSTTTGWAASCWPPSAPSTSHSTTSSARSSPECRSTSSARCSSACASTANGWTEGVEKSPASYAKRTKELVAKGYTGCKFDLLGSPVSREDARSCATQRFRQGDPRGRRPRLRHGHRRARAVEHQATIIRAIQGFRLFFYEEAVPPENIDAMVEVQRVVDAPLATGERIFGRHGFRGVAREAGGDHPARHRPHRWHHRIQEDRGDGRHALHPGRAAQSERADPHGRLDPRLRVDPELHPRVLRA